MHFYCAHCKTYLGTEEKTYLCSGCKRQIRFEECKRLKCVFLTTSIENPLLVGTSIFSKIMSGKKKIEKEGKGEILTGDGYKDPNIMKFLVKDENFSMTFSSDGVNIFNSSKDSLWPIFLSINEFNFKCKSKPLLMQGIWFGKKPNQHTFLRPFILEARKLFEQGFLWENEGKVTQSRVLFLIGVIDAPARRLLLVSTNGMELVGVDGVTILVNQSLRWIAKVGQKEQLGHILVPAKFQN